MERLTILEQSSAAIGQPWTEELHAALVHHVAEIERTALGVVVVREKRPLGYQAFMVAGRRADGKTPKLSKAVVIVANLDVSRYMAKSAGSEYAVYELSVETLDEVPMEGTDEA